MKINCVFLSRASQQGERAGPGGRRGDLSSQGQLLQRLWNRELLGRWGQDLWYSWAAAGMLPLPQGGSPKAEAFPGMWCEMTGLDVTTSMLGLRCPGAV